MFRRHKHKQHWWTSPERRAKVMVTAFMQEYFWDIVERRAAFTG
ncbi:hypothetical protein HOS45_gp088 [Gordonia phage BirksAndSocks]|uniref:Uncharacterized protein n=1 Tax=Gordonia phage BirksAndSocks TaxID=2047831 RepID=A0A2H4YDA9_9CAUD|nr:hypothetical protein HOS45_gp088 [Gordonia phage BirksAndSocks]AUE22159.1 hypothetical protein SEA_BIRKSANDSOCKS_47 [Gordonia phage BirksAndSocks]QOP65372.1 hypothetical protein SEA_DIABLA_46 [Gordonia phage Diabla]